jgi:hypothetical protein
MDPRYDARPDVKDRYTKPFKKDMGDIQAQTTQLIKTDPEIKKLAEDIKSNPTPEKISRFVAAVENKIDRLKFDLPNWSGNDFFDHGNGSELVKTDKHAQLGCVGEAASTGSIIMGLRDAGCLPPDTEWDYVSNGNHWAVVVYQKDKKISESPGFIIDSWLVSSGSPAPVFSSKQDWQTAVAVMGGNDNENSKKESEAFYAQSSKLQKSGVLPDGSAVKNYWVERKFDRDFLKDWQKKNLPNAKHPETVLYGGSYSDSITTHEVEQDRITLKYFLGDPPLIPGSEMKDIHFRSLRDRVAHIVEKDKDNPAIKAANLDPETIRSAKNFDELKPHLVKFYKAYDIDRDVIFTPKLTPEQVGQRIRDGGDLNNDKKINYSESVLLAEILRPALKGSPEALSALNALDWKDVSPDELANTVQGKMNLPKSPSPNR